MKQFRHLILVFLALCALGLLPASVLAQSGKSVTVKARNADISIFPNGDVRFVETWVVNFRLGSFTNAFRSIPKNRLRDITNLRVTEDDEELRLSIDRSDEEIKITWYFPDTNQGAGFFSETHTYVLDYTVQGAMRIYPNGDQFWWKFVEQDRGYTIESARARVFLPANFSPDQIRATTYTNGTETGGATILEDETIEFRGGPFLADTEWEIRTQFPHVITAPPEAWQQWDDRVEQLAARNNFYAAVVGVTLLVGGPLLLSVLWYLYGRDKPTTFQAEFLNAPPDDTPPGVVGTLLDERADLPDILATVADLAERGYLRIREGDAFGTPEYERTAKSADDLAPFEKSTLDALLGGVSMRRLEDVRGSFYYHIKELETALYNEVVSRGYFPRSPLQVRDLYFKVGKWGALLVPTVGLCAYCVTFIFAPLALFPVFALEFFFIGLLGLSRVMPQRTEKGALAYAKWSAFKRYLAGIEKYTNVEQAQDQFNKYLPYSIAFGLADHWINRFKQTTTPAPAWFIPYTQRVSSDTARDWSWPDMDSTRSTSSSFTPSILGTPGTGEDKPIFSDAPRPGPAPSLNEVANNSFLALNSVSSNMFDFLNTSAEAFVTKPPTRSRAQDFIDGVGDVLNWIGSSSGSSSSGSSLSWSSSSSSSSSSSGWSGGGSTGGRGSGGGSSGFG